MTRCGRRVFWCGRVIMTWFGDGLLILPPDVSALCITVHTTLKYVRMTRNSWPPQWTKYWQISKLHVTSCCSIFSRIHWLKRVINAYKLKSPINNYYMVLLWHVVEHYSVSIDQLAHTHASRKHRTALDIRVSETHINSAFFRRSSLGRPCPTRTFFRGCVSRLQNFGYILYQRKMYETDLLFDGDTKRRRQKHQLQIAGKAETMNKSRRSAGFRCFDTISDTQHAAAEDTLSAPHTHSSTTLGAYYFTACEPWSVHLICCFSKCQ